MGEVVRALGKVGLNPEVATREREFFAIAKTFAAADGHLQDAAERAQAARMPHVAEIFQKAAVSPGSSGNASWQALTEVQSTIGAFLTSLRGRSAFDALLPSMRRVPLRTRVSAVTLGAVGAAHRADQIMYKPISSLQLSGQRLDELTAFAVLVFSNEVLRLADPQAATFFQQELTAAVVQVTDEKFIETITTGAPSIASSGVDNAAIWTDLGNAFAALNTDASSKVFILMNASTAKTLATKVTSTGTAAFQLGYAGGELAGAPVVVCDGLAPATFAVVDANAIAANAGDLRLTILRQGDVVLNSTPDSPPTSLTVLQSLWASNQTGLKVERQFGSALLRSTGVVLVTNVNYRTGNSPA